MWTKASPKLLHKSRHCPHFFQVPENFPVSSHYLLSGLSLLHLVSPHIQSVKACLHLLSPPLVTFLAYLSFFAYYFSSIYNFCYVILLMLTCFHRLFICTANKYNSTVQNKMTKLVIPKTKKQKQSSMKEMCNLVKISSVQNKQPRYNTVFWQLYYYNSLPQEAHANATQLVYPSDAEWHKHSSRKQQPSIEAWRDGPHARVLLLSSKSRQTNVIDSLKRLTSNIKATPIDKIL